MQEILKVTDVNFERSDFSLNNISFKIYSGDIVGLIGENGAGKTTLFNVIFKNLEPSNGEISFLGDQHTKTDKSEMAIILDKNHFNASFTAIDINSIFSKVFKNWNKELFFSYIKEFELPKDKKINDYSHGMKVKLNFAYAFFESSNCCCWMRQLMDWIPYLEIHYYLIYQIFQRKLDVLCLFLKE